ncbi:MAG: DUF1559 domain-containing protein [Planctomycetaceae bacterium]|nr:DUF1559 domain-containing protein [Planctomycetaceae bacterium]
MADITLHEFPPSWWPLSNYGLAGLPFDLMVLVALLLIFSIRVSGSRWSCIIRLAVLIAVPPIAWQWQTYRHPSVFNPVKEYLTASLLLLLTAIAVQGAVRGFRRYRRSVQSWISIGSASLMGTLFGTLVLITQWPPGVSHAPRASAMNLCKNNLKQIGLALHNYHKVHRMFPTPVQAAYDRSWRVTLLPLLGRDVLYARYNQDAEWDHPSNLPLTEEIVPPLDCPGRRIRTDNQGRFITAYTALTGPGAAFETGKHFRIRDFTDGTPSTLMVTESCGKQVVCTEPKDVSTETDVLQINALGPQLHQSNGIASSYHMGGANMLMADGSVRMIGKDIDHEILERIISRAGEPAGQENLETDF